MDFLKGSIACSLVAVAVLLVAPGIARADDVMTIRYADGSSQSIRLERPSESIKQIEFSEGRRFGREESVRPSIRVVSGTYGRNCGAQYGNVTSDLAGVCEGKVTCEYTIDSRTIGDPVRGCPKDYFAEWQCGNNPEKGSLSVAPEAGNGTRIVLRCPVR